MRNIITLALLLTGLGAGAALAQGAPPNLVWQSGYGAYLDGLAQARNSAPAAQQETARAGGATTPDQPANASSAVEALD